MLILNSGKHSLTEEEFGEQFSHETPPLTPNNEKVLDYSNTVPLPFHWNEHHTRFRRHCRNCGSGNTQYLLFLLEMSGGIGASNFDRLKMALSALPIALCKPVKLAVMIFSHNYNLEFCFDCYNSKCSGRLGAMNAIRNITYRGGFTFTAGATQCACNVLLNESCGLPPDAACIDVIYITHGIPNDPPPLDICTEVRCLHNRFGVNTYAIGIGNYNNTKLDCITDPDNGSTSPCSIFRFESFERFISALNNVKTRLDNDHSGQYTCLDPQDPTLPGNQNCLAP